MTELVTTLQNSSDEELKPCPFCGADVQLRNVIPRMYRGDLYCINHPSKGCIMYGDSMYFNTEEDAIYFWNRRVNE